MYKDGHTILLICSTKIEISSFSIYSCLLNKLDRSHASANSGCAYKHLTIDFNRSNVQFLSKLLIYYLTDSHVKYISNTRLWSLQAWRINPIKGNIVLTWSVLVRVYSFSTRLINDVGINLNSLLRVSSLDFTKASLKSLRIVSLLPGEKIVLLKKLVIYSASFD